MESSGATHECYALYILSRIGELQTRIIDYRDKKSAMGAAWTQLRARPGCFALVIRFRNSTWASCSVYALDGGGLTPVAEPHQKAMRMSVDVHSLPARAVYPGVEARRTMDII